MRGYSSILQNVRGIMSRRVVHGSPPQQQQQNMIQLGIRRGVQTSSCLQEIYNINGEEDFKTRVMRSKLPVIVNFHADWCGPCQSLKPILDDIANEHTERLHLAEVLVDDHVDLLHLFEVTAVPAVLGIQNGMVTAKFVGLVSGQEIRTFVEKLLKEEE